MLFYQVGSDIIHLFRSRVTESCVGNYLLLPRFTETAIVYQTKLLGVATSANQYHTQKGAKPRQTNILFFPSTALLLLSLPILRLPIWPQAYNLAMEKIAALTRHTTNVATSTLSLKAAALTIHASGLVAVATTILQTTVRG